MTVTSYGGRSKESADFDEALQTKSKIKLIESIVKDKTKRQ